MAGKRPNIRCTGECCNGFTLRDNETGETEKVGVELGDDVKDLFYALEPGEDTVARFGCTAWDKETGLCTIYDKRPGMCVRFPHEMTCSICGASSPEDATAPALDEAAKTS